MLKLFLNDQKWVNSVDLCLSGIWSEFQQLLLLTLCCNWLLAYQGCWGSLQWFPLGIMHGSFLLEIRYICFSFLKNLEMFSCDRTIIFCWRAIKVRTLPKLLNEWDYHDCNFDVCCWICALWYFECAKIDWGWTKFFKIIHHTKGGRCCSW